VKRSISLLSIIGFTLIITGVLSCGKINNQEIRDFTQVILGDTSSFFYLDTGNYPRNNPALPIGIFDSGTGGLAVLEVILTLDHFDNGSHLPVPGGDGNSDFEEEYFIFLADQANMPYGNYSREKKVDLLKEHILKDAQFLLGKKYYLSDDSEQPQTDKDPIKVLVIACNTATAIGKSDIEKFMKEANLDIRVIGIIDAGAKAALDQFKKDEEGSIAVMATAGTVSSGGYVRTIQQQQKSSGYQADISVFQQAGVGLAGAIDGAREFIDPGAIIPRKGFQGPSDKHPELEINLEIISRYGFDWSSNHMLFEGDSAAPRNIQLNSVENYISYHLVTLLENIRTTPEAKKLKAVLLACTHYPFYTDFFQKKLEWLRNYQENGNYIYQPLLADSIEFIDPSKGMAIELYQFMKQKDLFNRSELARSEFYISIPNRINRDVQTDASGNFAYEYKYGREAGHFQEYVKRVPINRSNISVDTRLRLEEKVPTSFQLLRKFNRENQKLQGLRAEDKF
jgi:glutamate racemase